MRVALGLAWAGAVVVGGWFHRPAPARLRSLPPARGTRRGGGGGGGARPPATCRNGPVERIGALLFRLLRRGRPVSPATARRTGWSALVTLTALALLPWAAPLAGAAAWAAPAVRDRRAERRRLAAMAADLPEVVDLLVLAVGAGLSVRLAVEAVARRAAGPLAPELARVVHEVGMGRRLADALDDLPLRAGEATRPLTAALVSSERYGAPLAEGLARLADDVRRDRRRRAETAARQVPVKLLFPLVGCILPAFGLLTVAPLIAGAIRSLQL